MFENHQKCFIWIFLFLVFSINFYFDWAVWYHCMTASLYFQKESQLFLAFVLNTFRGHILRSIHHQSLLSVLARIQNTFCKKVYMDIFCAALGFLFVHFVFVIMMVIIMIISVQLYRWQYFSVWGLLLAVLVRNLGYVNVPFSYFFMPHFPDRRGR